MSGPLRGRRLQPRDRGLAGDGPLRAELALDALEMAIWSRRSADLGGLVHHSDRGVQYLSIRYTERLAEAGAVSSVGSRGDSYDNALAETVNGLYKAELINRQGPGDRSTRSSWRPSHWVHWWNTQPPPWCLRRHPAGRVRGGLPISARRPSWPPEIQSIRSPRNPVRFKFSRAFVVETGPFDQTDFLLNVLESPGIGTNAAIAPGYTWAIACAAARFECCALRFWVDHEASVDFFGTARDLARLNDAALQST